MNHSPAYLPKAEERVLSLLKDKREEVIRMRLDDNTVSKVTVVVEDWTYNFGPNRFMRIFTFRNGKVTDTRTGGYGN